MTTDLLLAALHHLLVFSLAAALVAEWALLWSPLTTGSVRRLARLDLAYGISAGLLLMVGACRVAFGVKGAPFYLHNPWFHAKLGVFLLVGLMSILPTLRFLRWRKAADATDAQPPASELAATRRVLQAEVVLLGAIFVLAAAMARYGGF